jgi:hypothetical protein
MTLPSLAETCRCGVACHSLSGWPISPLTSYLHALRPRQSTVEGMVCFVVIGVSGAQEQGVGSGHCGQAHNRILMSPTSLGISVFCSDVYGNSRRKHDSLLYVVS